MSRYHEFSRSAYYGVLAALPLLAAYEALLWLSAGPASYQIRNAADVWLRTAMASLGATPSQATLAMLLILILAIPLLRRRIPLVPRYFGWIVMEAATYSVVLFVLSALLPPLPATVLAGAVDGGSTAGFAGGVSAASSSRGVSAQGFSGGVSAQGFSGGVSASMPPGISLAEGVALSLGAGLFEELAFRVVLVTALLWGTRVVFANWLSVALSILGAAFLFSLAHYVGPFGEPYSPGSFLFRWAAGLVFTLLYYTRGFAVTAYTHALYDLWVLLA
jgi:membrane protease YdiL (CAAX protease family)